MSKENFRGNEMLGGLEELGLSKYEASAYLGLLGKGMVSATELAFCSDLPRTKIYFILKKLEKKKLVFINNQKPLTFRALPPKDSFSNILKKYEKKIKDMRDIIDSLQQINDEGLEKKGLEERRYLILNQMYTDKKIKELIKSSREKINIALNSWGNILLRSVKDEIFQAVIRGVKIRILFDNLSNADSIILPNAVDKKRANISTNLFIFDNDVAILINNDGTKSAYFDSHEIFKTVLTNHFKDIWDSDNNQSKIKSTTTFDTINVSR
ncbi:TrmB family transcriptional regulator [Candidatus Nitrosocosmicus franklandus]|uniref:Sugar-specific transcriptional regulator TrmB n=1 Tax=Candidatus Nitrosocosmicus franklandianus TaxID=1798806 RepID=A0A484I6E0_9ARCH|nr:helix-turn-helix domain-containing protein [Candidatus Nitrosocosmicus franklandus]VFJ12748.1 Sugar-specific transcriptional regulator TrmB [Candidatus Nitrosocosmicus franklandus]